VFLFYRTSPPSAREPFVSLEMRKTPMGWYVAEIPPSGLTDNAVRLFFEARDHDGLPVATNGNADASDIILVREGITVQDARQRRGGGCDNDILLYEIVPARAEWTWWTGAGAGARPAGGTMVANARLGGGISYGLGRLGAREVRGGPWISGETGFHGALGEGGLELLVASDREPTWDAIALRAGGGYGVDRGDRAPSISTTLTVGLRAVPARFHTRGPCEAVVPSERGHASVARLFLTTRDSFAGAGSVSIIAGVEIDPSLLLGSSRAQLHSARW
jgi:hypothetical protein